MYLLITVQSNFVADRVISVRYLKNNKLKVLNWWLVRVTLVVDWLFLPQNFGPVVGTFCSYVNGHWVGTVLPGGGDT